MKTIRMGAGNMGMKLPGKMAFGIVKEIKHHCQGRITNECPCIFRISDMQDPVLLE